MKKSRSKQPAAPVPSWGSLLGMMFASTIAISLNEGRKSSRRRTTNRRRGR